MDHLACFLPGVLALGVAHGAVSGPKALRYQKLAADLTETCYQMYARQPKGTLPCHYTLVCAPSPARGCSYVPTACCVPEALPAAAAPALVSLSVPQLGRTSVQSISINNLLHINQNFVERTARTQRALRGRATNYSSGTRIMYDISLQVPACINPISETKKAFCKKFVSRITKGRPTSASRVWWILAHWEVPGGRCLLQTFHNNLS